MYSNIREIKLANKRVGGNWFEPETMSFFASKVNDKVYHGKFFITSEQFEATDYAKERFGWTDGPRKFSVRMCRPDGRIITIGEHMKFNTLQEAEMAIEEITLLDNHYLLSPPGGEYGYRLFLPQTISESVKAHMDYLSIDGGVKAIHYMFFSGCEVYMWELNESRSSEALSYLRGYGIEKCVNRPELTNKP